MQEILKHSQIAKDCLVKTDRVRKILEEIIEYSLAEGGPYSDHDVVGSILNTIEIANLHTKYLLRKSEFRGQSANLCAEICDDCADQCARFREDDIMIFASEVCRECAVNCRDFVTLEEIT